MSDNLSAIAWSHNRTLGIFNPYNTLSKYRPIYDITTAQQQAVWSIMADVHRIRIDNANAVNSTNGIEHSL